MRPNAPNDPNRPIMTVKLHDCDSLRSVLAATKVHLILAKGTNHGGR